MKKLYPSLWLTVFLLILLGCATSLEKQETYLAPNPEVQWIINGQPLEFEKTLWYPTDIVENLLDDEVYLMGEYQGVQFFAEKSDVRPYERLYTKFGKHKFRIFEKRK
ncbi:MAG: hypothetical protein Q8N14_07210 [Candidatus Omnitrophota bacterium]|nr:hypothetical protein [Candidatus Omnitrophota bacterium]